MVCQFKVSDFGRSFATRGRGRELREELLHRTEGAGAVTVDFAGVERVTYSFADEFIGVLDATEDVDPKLIGMGTSVACTMSRVAERRASSILPAA